MFCVRWVIFAFVMGWVFEVWLYCLNFVVFCHEGLFCYECFDAGLFVWCDSACVHCGVCVVCIVLG